MNEVVAFALRQRVLVVVLLALTMVAGLIGFLKLNIEAYPDPVPPMVDIITQNPGQSAEEIERYISIPIEIQMAGIPHVASIRTISLFGLSDVKVQFTYNLTYREAEQWVINRLGQLPPLPGGAQPQLSPTSPIGEVYRYRVAGPPGYSVTDLKTIQDWMLQRRFKAVPGVIDVNGWGGKTKTFEITVDQQRLVSFGLTVPQVIAALNNANVNVGGQTVNIGSQSAVIRGVGLIHSMDDIRRTVLASAGGSPVLLGDVADVTVGARPRLGIAGQDADDDIVQGIVLMHRGEKSAPTIQAVIREVERINASGVLPPGVRIERIYDRSDLISVTTLTVVENMAMGMLLIFLVQWLFLGNLKSAVIVSATIPFALFFAVLIMLAKGDSANLLSVGAVDFGLIVDASVIMVENIFRHLTEAPAALKPHRTKDGKARLLGHLGTIYTSSVEVNRAIFFSAAIIIAGFVPLFTLSGIEGHIFGPMAQTYAYAIGGGLIATFTVSPALSALMFAGGTAREHETALMRRLRRGYDPMLRFALANRVLVLGGAAGLTLAALLAARLMGLEFLPHLEEGNMWIRATLPGSISLEAGNPTVNAMRTYIKGFPEVMTVISQHGRPDDGTDATGFFNAEFFVPLKPFSTWPKGMDKEKLIREMSDGMEQRFPGVEVSFSQYIEDNVQEAASGVKGQNSVKLIGNDLHVLEGTANRIKTVLESIPGISNVVVAAALGQPTVRIDIDRERAARFGLNPGDINATVQAAIGGQAAGNLYEDGSDRNFPMVVRLASEYRASLDAIRRIRIGAPAPGGSGVIQVPLDDVAEVKLVTGASFIYRENQQRYIPVNFSVRGRDLGGAILEAQDRVARDVKLPSGYRLDWAGEFGEMQEAMGRLALVVPLSLLLIGLLLYVNFGSAVDALLAASVMPMALIGGILALVVTGTPFSVSAAIGFVALFGTSVMGGIIVLECFNDLVIHGVPRAEAVIAACETRMRPVMMTCFAACVGLLPAAVSTGIGSQVQRPLALVVVGGILLAPVLILVVLPVLIDMFSRRGVDDGEEETEGLSSHAAE